MREISVAELNLNPMTMFGRDWCLATAGNAENGFNTMTIAWGNLGATWDQVQDGRRSCIPTATVYLRPSRYTKEFFDRENRFSICAFGPEYQKTLGYLGTHSGRDGDKVAAVGLTPLFVDGTTAFAEAKLVLICEKLYNAPLAEDGFADQSIVPTNYPDRDFHEMYIGRIIKVLKSE